MMDSQDKRAADLPLGGGVFVHDFKFGRVVIGGAREPRPLCSQESRAASSEVTQRSLVSLMPSYVIMHPGPAYPPQ